MEIPCETCLIRPRCVNTDIGILLNKCKILNNFINDNMKDLVDPLNEFCKLMYVRKR
jgi:hypothetical protein